MGFFDAKTFLTGENGIVQEGDSFVIHGARIAGEVRNVNPREGDPARIPEAELMVSRTGRENPIAAYTTGRGIVQQVQRMDDRDRQTLPWAVRLEAKPLDGGRTLHTIVRADATDADPTPSPDQTPGATPA